MTSKVLLIGLVAICGSVSARSYEIASLPAQLSQLATPPLVHPTLSPEAPVQGDPVTVFFQLETGFQSPRAVSVFLKVALDGGADLPLLHPSEGLWVAQVGPFQSIAAHAFTVQTVVEDLSQSQRLHDAIIGLNQEISNLQSEISCEPDPGRRVLLQESLSQKLTERGQLENAILALRSTVGSDQVQFQVSANTNSPSFPHIISVSPDFGVVSAAGRSPETVSISGSGFTAQSQVVLGGVAAASVQFVSAQTLQAAVPALPVGAQSVEVRVPSGATAGNAILNNAFFVISGAGPGGGIMPVLHPVAFAGYPQNRAPVGTPVTLSGSLSYDDNGDPLTYVWHFLSVPQGSTLTDANLGGVSGVATTQFTPDVPGNYVISLVVNNGVWSSVPSLTVVSSFIPVGIALAPQNFSITTRLGQSASQSVTLTNISSADTLIIPGFPTESGDPLGELSLNLDGCTSAASCSVFPLQLGPGGQIQATLTYTPVAAGESLGVSYLFVGHDSVNVMQSLQVSATSTGAFPLVVEQNVPGLAAPVILYSASQSSGPSLVVPTVFDTALVQPLGVLNAGAAPVTIPNVPQIVNQGQGPQLSVDSTQFPLTIPANTEAFVNLSISPGASGSGANIAQGVILWDFGLLLSDPTAQIQFYLATGGNPPPSQEILQSIAFGDVLSGQPSVLTQSLIPTDGSFPFSWVTQVQSLSISGAQASFFQYSLPAGESVPFWESLGGRPGTLPIPFPVLSSTLNTPVTVTFDPGAAGDYSADLNVILEGYSVPLVIPLSGSASGVKPPACQQGFCVAARVPSFSQERTAR